MWNPEMTANSMVSSRTWGYFLFFLGCQTQQMSVYQLKTSAFMKQPSKECEPYRTSEGLPIAPCGAIANSLFNGESGCLWSPAQTHTQLHCMWCFFSILDTLTLYYYPQNGTKLPVPLTKKGIAWWTDKHVKFRNPGGSANLSIAFQGEFDEFPSSFRWRIWISQTRLSWSGSGRYGQARELEESGVPAGRGSWEQRLHQRGLHRVDAHGGAAHLPEALSHNPEEAEHHPDSIQRQICLGNNLQYPFESKKIHDKYLYRIDAINPKIYLCF